MILFFNLDFTFTAITFLNELTKKKWPRPREYARGVESVGLAHKQFLCRLREE